jgi:hypothetical protein
MTPPNRLVDLSTSDTTRPRQAFASHPHTAEPASTAEAKTIGIGIAFIGFAFVVVFYLGRCGLSVLFENPPTDTPF